MPVQLRFGRTKLKTPPDLVSRINTTLATLREDQTVSKGGKTQEKATEDLARYVEQMKVYLLGDNEHSPDKNQAILLTQELAKYNLIIALLEKLNELEFETRKDIALVVTSALRLKDENERYILAEHFVKSPNVLEILFDGYKDTYQSHVGLISGSLLRECIRHGNLAKIMAESSILINFFEEIEERKFEIAADAFATFKDLITKHPEMIASVLEKRYEEFFQRYNRLINSENFFTKRQMLNLLGDLLCAPSNINIMLRYVSQVRNLMTMMNLLRDHYESIQFEAFHVFKIFVAVPGKSPEVLEILTKNKEKLLKFLTDFQNERVESDEDFGAERAELIRQIGELNYGSSDIT